MLKKIVGMILSSLILAGCVANRTIQTIQPGDENLSCAALKSELSRLGARFEDAKNESGVTGENVAMAILFWPAIIVNESQSSKNQESINRRISHLTSIYNTKCLTSADSTENVAKKLQELKNMYEKGLISDKEYKKTRKSLLKAI